MAAGNARIVFFLRSELQVSIRRISYEFAAMRRAIERHRYRKSSALCGHAQQGIILRWLVQV